jgi:hypothetical protein
MELIEHFSPPAEFDALLRTIHEASRNDKTGELELIVIASGYTAKSVY